MPVGRVSESPADEQVGAARLPVVAIVAFGSFIFSSMLEYSLPLFFSALPDFPRGMWAGLVAWQVAPWCFGPILAGVLARRYGERQVWSVALWGQAVVPLVLLLYPRPSIVAPLAFWNGLTAALMWVGGISLAQVVPNSKKGLANGLVMTALGVGSLTGPLLGRAILWHEECYQLWQTSGPRAVGLFLVDIVKPSSNPEQSSFELIFILLTASTILNALLIGLWGQQAGKRTVGVSSMNWRETARDLQHLARQPRYWALVGSLCLCGGPVFQAMNQFLFYRAADLGLIVESTDRGWIVLHFIRMGMWIVGGLAVGMLAGKRAGAIVVASILAAFSLAAIGVGTAHNVAMLFTTAIVFEFLRQFMRWSHAGYMAEQFEENVRATAIGGAITVAGISSTAFGFAANALGDSNSPDFDSSKPFLFAGAIGVIGALGLFIFDRQAGFRQSEGESTLDATMRTHSPIVSGPTVEGPT